ncbi:hypothetical protein OCEANICA350_12633 [Oceanicaulis sp. 350]|nr:hypothetical protein OCEANICA350_12633 [Oceanicaulis sp. 350]
MSNFSFPNVFWAMDLHLFYFENALQISGQKEVHHDANR